MQKAKQIQFYTKLVFSNEYYLKFNNVIILKGKYYIEIKKYCSFKIIIEKYFNFRIMIGNTIF